MTAGSRSAQCRPGLIPRDAWIGPGGSIEEIPDGARVGTASLRRRGPAQGAPAGSADGRAPRQR